MLKVLLSLLVLGSAKLILLSGSKTVMLTCTPILEGITQLCWGPNLLESISTRRSEINSAESYLESEESMDVIDLVERRKADVFILNCAVKLFPCVGGIIPVPDLPSMLISRDGGLIAYGWINENGHAEFKPAVPRDQLS